MAIIVYPGRRYFFRFDYEHSMGPTPELEVLGNYLPVKHSHKFIILSHSKLSYRGVACYWVLQECTGRVGLLKGCYPSELIEV